MTRRLRSQHGTDLSRQFSDVANAAAGLPDAVHDGEFAAVLNDSSGVALDQLQSRARRRGPRSGADFTVHVALFDVGDTDWRPRSYAERRTELLRLLEDSPAILRAVPATEDRGQALTWIGALADVEGLVGERTGAPYVAGPASGW
ncbi:hypothetical protein ACIBJF_45970 [Streptomyces sp. NPDC050743]|uniref:hypothetical protein n=1 Tax=Streptomyces sp. NPDC050743 TaxID=3365634 RepID=UPI0037BAC53D